MENEHGGVVVEGEALLQRVKLSSVPCRVWAECPLADSLLAIAECRCASLIIECSD